jgi:dienelactone hydrolase
MQVLLCHSVLGLREAEREAADALRAAGHSVSVPDLFGGARAASIDEGAAIVEHVGWTSVCARAQDALGDLPATTVLAGFSMGVGVASELWRNRPNAAGAVFLHALPTIPAEVRPRFPLQVHVGEADAMFANAAAIESLAERSEALGASLNIFRYPRAGHFFTDRTLPEFDQPASIATWDRVLEFLAMLQRDD